MVGQLHPSWISVRTSWESEWDQQERDNLMVMEAMEFVDRSEKQRSVLWPDPKDDSMWCWQWMRLRPHAKKQLMPMPEAANECPAEYLVEESKKDMLWVHYRISFYNLMETDKFYVWQEANIKDCLWGWKSLFIKNSEFLQIWFFATKIGTLMLYVHFPALSSTFILIIFII